MKNGGSSSPVAFRLVEGIGEPDIRVWGKLEFSQNQSTL